MGTKGDRGGSADWHISAEDAAFACGYTPLHIAIGTDEWITDRVDFGGISLVMTSGGKALYVTDFYGDFDSVMTPNVCRDLDTVCHDLNYRAAFMDVLRNRELSGMGRFDKHSPIMLRLYGALGISTEELLDEYRKHTKGVLQ